MDPQPVQIIPYLSFWGNCEKAIRTYLAAFGDPLSVPVDGGNLRKPGTGWQSNENFCWAPPGCPAEMPANTRR